MQRPFAQRGSLTRARSQLLLPVVIVAMLAVGGCEAVKERSYSSILGTGERAALNTKVLRSPSGAVEDQAATGTRLRQRDESPHRRGPEYLEPGTGPVVGTPAKGDPVGTGQSAELTLNFENTSVLNVVKVIITDMLGESYVVDPAVQGTVTLQTTKPIQRAELLPTLELMLRMNGAALVWSEGLYHVVPRDAAVQGLLVPQLGDSDQPLPKGYALQIIPLRNIAAEQMRAILDPMTSPGNIMRVDAQRNLLIVAGTGKELAVIRETVDVFDVDWMAGQAIALFTPEFVDAKTLSEELSAMIGAQSSPDAMVRLVPVDRLDALLVISPSRTYVDRIGKWIDRLDRDTGASGQRLFVYHVENGKAVDLAKVLGEVFQAQEEQRIRAAQVAPGLRAEERASRIRTQPDDEAERGQATGESAPAARAVGVAAAGLSVTPGPELRIIADEVNNALLIMATAAQFRQVQSALRELDIAPLQVLIEATIAEVSLTGELSQGLEWFFKNHIGGSNSGVATLDVGAAGIASLVPGFSYAVTEASVVKAVLNILAKDSRANIVSSPSIMVLNNQQATIQVGDQVPITTQQQQSTSTNSNVINNIEFRDTGVLLTVTPRVNSGGLVIMEVEQEVSNVAPGDANTLTPTIQQRKIASTVAVQSAETVVLGGLIKENKSEVASGIPGLYQLPVVGKLFGTETDQASRTELVVLITPRAVRGVEDARDVTDEFRRKMESLKPLTSQPGQVEAGAVSQTAPVGPPASIDAKVRPVGESPAHIDKVPLQPGQPASEEMLFEREMSYPGMGEPRQAPRGRPSGVAPDVVAHSGNDPRARLDLKVSEQLRSPQAPGALLGGVNRLWGELLALLAPSPRGASHGSPAANP